MEPSRWLIVDRLSMARWPNAGDKKRQEFSPVGLQRDLAF